MCLFLLCIVPPAPSLGGSDVATIVITLLIARALSQPTGSEDSLIAVTNCPLEIYEIDLCIYTNSVDEIQRI